MVTVYLNVYVVGRLLFISASLVKPDGCVRFVQFSFGVLIKADSHLSCRAHAGAHAVPLPCRALIHTLHAAPLPYSDNAVSFLKVRVVAGNIRTASSTV